MPTKGAAYYNGPDRKKDLEAYALRAPYPGEWLPSPSFLSGRDGDRIGGRLVATSTTLFVQGA